MRFLVEDSNIKWYDWKASLDMIEQYYHDGKISKAFRSQVRQKIKDFSRNLNVIVGREAGQTATSHMPVMQEYQRGITQFQKYIDAGDRAALAAKGLRSARKCMGPFQ
jgi:hypothetical protein